MDCETCQGKGEVFQESGVGTHATANMGWVECPDCDGKGEIEVSWFKTQYKNTIKRKRYFLPSYQST